MTWFADSHLLLMLKKRKNDTASAAIIIFPTHTNPHPYPTPVLLSDVCQFNNERGRIGRERGEGREGTCLYQHTFIRQMQSDTIL